MPMRKVIACGLIAGAVALGVGQRVISGQSAPPAPTFSRDVAPILYKNCVSCHQPNSMAPMSLLDYKTVRPYARAIRSAVEARKMPPWFADPQFGHFANEMRLTDREIRTIAAWVDAGAPEGDVTDLPPQP